MTAGGEAECEAECRALKRQRDEARSMLDGAKGDIAELHADRARLIRRCDALIVRSRAAEKRVEQLEAERAQFAPDPEPICPATYMNAGGLVRCQKVAGHAGMCVWSAADEPEPEANPGPYVFVPADGFGDLLERLGIPELRREVEALKAAKR